MNNSNEHDETKHLGDTEEVATRWQNIKKLFEAASALTGKEREKFFKKGTAAEVDEVDSPQRHRGHRGGKLNPVNASTLFANCLNQKRPKILGVLCVSVVNNFLQILSGSSASSLRWTTMSTKTGMFALEVLPRIALRRSSGFTQTSKFK